MGETIADANEEEADSARVSLPSGSEITLPQLPPVIDETAALSIRLATRGGEVALRLPSQLARLGTRTLAAIRRERAEPDPLSQRFLSRTSDIAVVGRIDPNSPHGEQQRQAAQTAASLRFGYVISTLAPQVTGIFTLESGDQQDDDSLGRTASLLLPAVNKETAGYAMLFQPNTPLCVPKEATVSNPRPIYEVIDSGMSDLEAYVSVEHNRGEPVAPHAAKAVIIAHPAIAELFGVDPDHLEHGGAAIFKQVGKTAVGHVWKPLSDYVPYVRPGDEAIFEAPAEADHRTGRFTRGADTHPRVDQPTHTGQIAPVEAS